MRDSAQVNEAPPESPGSPCGGDIAGDGAVVMLLATWLCSVATWSIIAHVLLPVSLVVVLHPDITRAGQKNVLDSVTVEQS